MLKADYTAALTLLLRYPVPSPPHGPTTFVSDALYLRDNLLFDGGDHIISKYSRRAPETTVTRKLPKKIRRARTAEQEAAQSAALRTAPAGIHPQQSSIEAIIHEAAKGVYTRSAKWGVGKALRGAMEGLQSGHRSPARTSDRSRLSIDEGKTISDKPTDPIAKIRALEQRNKSLAKLLENAVDELWVQQKQIHEKDNEAAANALSLSIAKVQFVQVYLENPSMPLPTDTASSSEDNGKDGIDTPANKSSLLPPTLPLNLSTKDDVVEAESSDPSKPVDVPSQQNQQLDKPSQPSTPRTGSPSKPSSPRPRPSLEKSPFSLMLGDDQRKSEFVASSPFPPEKRANGHSRKLFGELRGKNNSKGQGNAGVQARGDGTGDDDDGDDIFTMGLSEGRRGR